MPKKRLILRSLLGLLLALVVVVGCYVAYVFIDYHRIPDMQPLETAHHTEPDAVVIPGETYTAISYNIGFGAYTPDYSFFMDGGESSWAVSKQSVQECITGAGTLAASYSPDFIFFEEVDLDSTRSWHVDQKAMLDELLTGYDSSFAINYDSSFLFYPFIQPHGKSVSSLAIYSRYPMSDGLRRSLPITTSVMKLVDLDRCYMVHHVPMSSGHELVLYTVHMTAYSSDPTVREAQLEMMLSDMMQEYEAGNAVICGGDFNMEMLSTALDGSTPDWARPIDREALGLFVNTWDVLTDEQRASQCGTCRDAGEAYVPGRTEVYTLDTFLVSPNVTVVDMTALDTGFAWSDHNPVMLTFSIQ